MGSAVGLSVKQLCWLGGAFLRFFNIYVNDGGGIRGGDGGDESEVVGSVLLFSARSVYTLVCHRKFVREHATLNLLLGCIVIAEISRARKFAFF